MSTVTEVNPRLLALTEAGVSVWLDQIRRTLVQSGELSRMVVEDCLRGVTSNPSIFEQAILGSTDYDEDLVSLARRQLDAVEIYEYLAMRDVQLAADALAAVHRESHGRDGFVSLEVSPRVTHDTEGTLAEARAYWQQLDRPNVMIKIPATLEGIRATEQALYDGINVNVTLLFAVSAYERVAEAYLRALERRLEAGLPLDVSSVASFFVSRVDTHVDRKLAELGREDLRGHAAIANARAAYRRFTEIFDGPRWAALRHAGAAVQRPLWASTSTKDPSYPDTMYVDELVGTHAVNTMPMQTLLAVADHGRVRGPTAERDPTPVLTELSKAGVDLGQVTDELLVDGVNQFEEAFRRLLGGIEQQRAAATTPRPPTTRATWPSDAHAQVVERAR
ncbi:MAG TPA: transaldolase [Solirubrobacteraceae bacterium]|jgi:transaldolase|nr:transaldolase [Solirubrobacteraceae bacterium]